MNKLVAERSDIVSDPLDLIIINSTSTNIYDTLTIVENSSENKAIDVDVDSLYTFSKNSKEKKRATFGRRRIHKAETMESPATTRSLDDVWPFVIDYHHLHQDAGLLPRPALGHFFPAHLRVIVPESCAGHTVLQEFLQVVRIRARHPPCVFLMGFGSKPPFYCQRHRAGQRCVRAMLTQQAFKCAAGCLEPCGVIELGSAVNDPDLVFLRRHGRRLYIQKEFQFSTPRSFGKFSHLR